MTKPDGEKSEGEFREGKIWNGYGTENYARGDKYVGDFKYGKRHGLGTYIFSFGKKYIGEWKRGMLHGQGVEINQDGEIKYIGQWNRFAKDEGIVIYKSGRMRRKEPKASRTMQVAVRDHRGTITYSGRMHSRNT